MVCEHCGKPVAPADRYCAVCLTPRTPSPSPPPPHPAPAEASFAQPAPLPTTWVVPPPAWGAPPSPPATAPAGFWLRVAAMLIDGVILGFAMGALVLGLAVVGGFAAASMSDAASPLLGAVVMVAWVTAMAGQWAYFAFMESSSRQATLGKMALGLTVTDLGGRRLGLGRATGRYFAKILSTLPLHLGYLLAAFTERKQALHDLVAGTLVVRRGQPRVPVLVIALLAGILPMIAIVGILAAIAIPNFLRYQLRAKDAEAPAMLRSLHAAELAHHAVQGRYMEVTVPDGAPGQAKLAWSAENRAAARSIGWAARGPSYFTYRVAVKQTEDGAQAFATCAEADLDGDGVVAAWVTWQPVTLPGGERVAPEPPCAHAPMLDRTLGMREGDPAGKPVRVSPADVF